MASSEPTLINRARAWFSSLPLFSKSVFTLCVGLYVIGLFFGDDSTESVCMSAERTFRGLQLYRIFTSSVFHLGPLHLVFNMLAFVSMGQQLERLVGTVQFGYLVLLFDVLGAVVYSVAVQLLYQTRIYPRAASECVVGLSGTIFGLIVVSVVQSRAASQSIFGLFEMPSKLYPWALLVFWQLLVPNVSFLGHLSGVCVGQMWAWGWLKRLDLPRAWVHRVESALTPAHSLGGFVHANQLPTTAPPHGAAGPSASRDRGPQPDTVGGWLARLGGSSIAPFLGKANKIGTKLTHVEAAPLSEPFQAAQRAPVAAVPEMDPDARRAAVAAAAEARLLGAGAKAASGTAMPLATQAVASSSSSVQSSTGPHAGPGRGVTAPGTLLQTEAAVAGPAFAQARAGASTSHRHDAVSAGDSREAHSFQAGMLKLQEMGFQPAVAYSALTGTGGDVDAALERLLQQS